MSPPNRAVGSIITACLLWPLLQTSCNPLECGEGTREENGECVPLSRFDPDAGIHCGGNTVLVGNECVPEEEICGEFTRAEPELDDAGVPTGYFICIGQGTGDDQPPECPPEFGPNGEICINGWVKYLMDDSGNILDTSVADPEAAEDATRLEILVYDPLAYVSDPNVPPLGRTEVNPRKGTFIVTDIDVPALVGAVALAVEDIDNGTVDDFAFTGIPYLAGNGQHLEYVNAASITNDQNDEWTAEIGSTALEGAGCDVGATLEECGTWIGVYAYGVQGDPGSAIEGVTSLIMPLGNPIAPEKTFFMGYTPADGVVFDDPTAGVVWSDGDGPHEWTGKSGVVFYPTASLGLLSGLCAASTPCSEGSCAFQEYQGGAAPNALFVQYMFPRPNTCTE